ncbi:uncharacterized protein PAC_08045 [Phialocephala subalpina]|uniref:Uncharacterized protein n=1 Tax=Phialocephala subalpina TaxID=576137 RepID=A0A1L7WZG8_9HELO|nr:uncharacterized protein PAC_08045 [Phialocephala subalpina]
MTSKDELTDRPRRAQNDSFQIFKKHLKAAVLGPQPDKESKKQEGSLEKKDDDLNWGKAESKPAKNMGVQRRPLEKRKKMTKQEYRDEERALPDRPRSTYDWNTYKEVPPVPNSLDDGYGPALTLENTKEKESREREEKLKADIYQMRKDMYALEDIRNSEMSRYRDECDAKLINQEQQNAAEMAMTKSQYEEDIVRLTRHFEEEHKERDAELYQIRNDHKQEIAAYNKRTAVLESQCEDQGLLLEKLKADLSNAKETEERKIKVERSGYEERLRAERSRYEAQMSSLEQKHSEEMNLLHRDHEKELYWAKNAHAAEMGKMSKESDLQRNNLESQLARQKQEYAEVMKAIRQQHEDELHQTKGELAAERERLRMDIDLQHKDSETQLTKLREEYAEGTKAMRREHEEKLAQIKQDHESLKARHNICETELQKTKDIHAEEKKAIQSEYDSTIARIYQQHNEDLETRFVGLEKKLAKTVDGHQSQLRGMEYKHDDNVKGMKADIERLTREMKNHVDGENYYKMLLADEKARRKSAVRRFREIEARLVVVEGERTLNEEAKE